MRSGGQSVKNSGPGANGKTERKRLEGSDGESLRGSPHLSLETMWTEERIDVLYVELADHAVDGFVRGLVVSIEQCVGIAIQCLRGLLLLIR